MILNCIRHSLLALTFVLLSSAASVAMAQHHGGSGGHMGGGHMGGGGFSGGHLGGVHMGGGSYHGGGISHSGTNHINYGSHSGYGFDGFGLGYSRLGYGGLGYGGLGYGGLGYGYSSYGSPYSSSYSSGYRGYLSYPSTTYVPSSTRYQAGYGRMNSSTPAATNAPIDPATADLRPGMVLPDGSVVVSVGPITK